LQAESSHSILISNKTPTQSIDIEKQEEEKLSNLEDIEVSKEHLNQILKIPSLLENFNLHQSELEIPAHNTPEVRLLDSSVV